MTTPNPNNPTPPRAAIDPKTITTHDDVRVDDYFWLRERENPDVIAHLEAENAYTQALTGHTDALQKTLYQEMRGRIKEEDLSVPAKHGDYYYYSRTEEGAQYPIYCRKYGTLDASEEVLLDQNKLAAGHDFMRLGAYNVSPDHRLLIYATDTSGGESYTLHVKNLETGAVLPDEIPNVYYGTAWGNDNQTIFYTLHDEALRPNRLMRHRLGDDIANDVLVHQEDDEMYFLGVYKTKDDAHIMLRLSSKITNEVWFIPADAPESAPTVIHPREHGVEYRVEHHNSAQYGDRFIITTNDNALNFRVMEAPVATPGKEQWSELIPHRNDVKLDYVESFRHHLVLCGRAEGLSQMWVMSLDPAKTDQVATHRMDFPEPVYDVWPHSNPDFESAVLRFSYTSLTTPDSVYDYHMSDQSHELKKRKEIPSGFDPDLYEAQRLYATANDGTQIPISLVRRKNMPQDQPAPTLLYGYGSYGASIDPSFNANRFSLVDRGMTFAIAHVRGGGEMGRAWYEDGKFLAKKNTFTDFIACAEHLITEGYTTPAQLVAEGRSAGGLLMGAITNMRPDLFAGIVAGVPFVDVINTMLDPSIPLTVIEWEEWGDPNDPVYYDYMKSYSPYDNVEAKAYPNILATAGLNDPRVQYWEPAKWVAKLRKIRTDDNRLLLKTNMGAGHGGSSGRFDYLEEVAFDYAFLLDVLGIKV